MSVSSSHLNSLFLQELTALDTFMRERTHDAAVVNAADDPDVRRLIEGMAFFSARTRATAENVLTDTVQRLAKGALDNLFALCPAALMVQMEPTPLATETLLVPKGSELRVITQEGNAALFTTRRALTVLPLRVQTAQIIELKRVLHLRIELLALRDVSVAQSVALYVRRFNDYRASLFLLDALEQHCVSAVVESAAGGKLPCRVTFGAEPEAQFESELGEDDALARVRAFFHLPEQELFMNLDLPFSLKAGERVVFDLELAATFPPDLGVSADTFWLGVVPASNVWSAAAEPFVCDGTQQERPILTHSATLNGIELLRVHGVFRTGDAGRTPIFNAALGLGGDNYEVEMSSGQPTLRLDVEGSFEKPCRIQIDAEWSQPDLWLMPPGKLSLGLVTRRLPLLIKPASGLRRPEASVLRAAPGRALDLLALKLRPLLNRADLLSLLEIVGANADGPYRNSTAAVMKLQAKDVPDKRGSGRSFSRAYELTLRQQTPEEACLLRRLAQQVAALLDAWTEVAIELNVALIEDSSRRALSRGALV